MKRQTLAAQGERQTSFDTPQSPYVPQPEAASFVWGGSQGPMKAFGTLRKR